MVAVPKGHVRKLLLMFVFVLPGSFLRKCCPRENPGPTGDTLSLGHFVTGTLCHWDAKTSNENVFPLASGKESRERF